jgi:hypothetical protein
MYCPQCGQPQVSNHTRFCSRCGFPLEGVSAVLGSGGLLPGRQAQSTQISPRGKGVRQGALMMLSTLPIVPLVAVFTTYFHLSPALLVPIVAISLFVGGLFRIFYALLMEDDAPKIEADANAYVRPQSTLEYSPQHQALPPGGVNATASWRARPNTAEIYQPPSITENTTRLLDKEEPEN